MGHQRRVQDEQGAAARALDITTVDSRHLSGRFHARIGNYD
jgi:hypothetical protein